MASLVIGNQCDKIIIIQTCFILVGAISPKSISWNILVIFWFLFTIIIIAAYLTACLTVSVTTLPVKTLEELAISPDLLPIANKGTLYVQLFQVRKPYLSAKNIVQSVNYQKNNTTKLPFLSRVTPDRKPCLEVYILKYGKR